LIARCIDLIYIPYQDKPIDKVLIINLTGHIVEFTKYPSKTKQSIFPNGKFAEFSFKKCLKISDFEEQCLAYTDDKHKIKLNSGYITYDNKLIMEMHIVYDDIKLEAILEFYSWWKPEDITEYEIHHKKLSNGKTIYQNIVLHKDKKKEELFDELIHKAHKEEIMTLEEAIEFYRRKIFETTHGVLEIQSCDL
jgi:hypothetical protein